MLQITYQIPSHLTTTSPSLLTEKELLLHLFALNFCNHYILMVFFGKHSPSIYSSPAFGDHVAVGKDEDWSLEK